jgi:hypothetical protein
MGWRKIMGGVRRSRLLMTQPKDCKRKKNEPWTPDVPLEPTFPQAAFHIF